jgi:guanine nucleotide-binding protein subunit alpha, other
MGGCLTLDREEALAKRRSNEIDKQLQEYAKNESNVIKILLLGKSYFIYFVHKN